jgi:hypothetical protein
MFLVRVLRRGQVIDTTNNRRPAIIPSDRIFETFAPVPPPLSSSQSNVSAQVGLTDDEESNNEGENAAPAAGGATSAADDDAQCADATDEKGDHISDNSNRVDPYDDLGEPSDDVTAALICLRDKPTSQMKLFVPCP